jgi:hypothetical protein
MRRLLPALVLFLFTGAASAQVPADLAAEYLETTQLPAQTQQVGSQLTQQIQGQVAQFPEPAQEPFRTIYGDALTGESLNARLQAYIADEAEADSVRAVLDWFEQPLVARMQDLEMMATEDDQAQVALQMYAMTGSFADYTPSEEREGQIDRYLAATESAENAVNLYLDIIVASAESSASILESDDAPPADSIRARMRPQLEGAIGGMVRGGSLYTFREVTDADFEAYIEQLESPAAQYGMALNADAMRAALVGAITDAGTEFAQTLRDLDAAGEIDLDAMRAEAEAAAEQQRQQQMQQSQGMEEMDDGR